MFGAAHHLGRKMGLDTVGFLMMAHMAEPEKILEQATLMESYGANCLYVTDPRLHAAGRRHARFALLRDKLRPETELGFHGHHNLSMVSLTRWLPSKPGPALTAPARHGCGRRNTRWRYSSPYATA